MVRILEKKARLSWHKNLNMGNKNYKFHDHENLAHYANAACDIEFKFPFGFKELEGIHSRTDFDLKAHMEYSGKKMQYLILKSMSIMFHMLLKPLLVLIECSWRF